MFYNYFVDFFIGIGIAGEILAIIIIAAIGIPGVSVCLLVMYPPRCCKKHQSQQQQAAALQLAAVNPADIPVQVIRGQNDEPEVHIGLDQEQQTHEIEDILIPSEDEETPSDDTVPLPIQ